MNAQKLYDTVLRSSNLDARLTAGNNGVLEVVETGWLAKEDKPGLAPFVEHEYAIYELLEAEGLTGDIVPECRFEEGWCPLVISRINDCASFGEYFEQILLGNMTESLWLDMCAEVGRAVRAFHDAGFIHSDLHGGNIVLEVHGVKWKAFLIDFGYSSHESLPNPHITSAASARGPEGDVEDLVEAIRLPLEGTDPPPWVEKGIELLERTILLA